MASDAGVKNYGYMRKSELADSLGLNASSGNIFESIFKFIFLELAFVVSSLVVGFSPFFIVLFLCTPIEWSHVIRTDWMLGNFAIGFYTLGFLGLTLVSFFGLHLSAFLRRVIFTEIAFSILSLVIGFTGMLLTMIALILFFAPLSWIHIISSDWIESDFAGGVFGLIFVCLTGILFSGLNLATWTNSNEGS